MKKIFAPKNQIIFNLFIGEYLREGVGANDFAYRLFLFFYLIVILSSFAIPTIVKRMFVLVDSLIPKKLMYDKAAIKIKAAKTLGTPKSP